MKQKGAEQLRAKQEAYGGNLDRKEVFKIVLPYMLVYGISSGLLFWKCWLWIIILTLIGAILGFVVLVPPNVSINYYRAGLAQRHLFINSMTQAISSKSQTMIHALHIAQLGLHGEFKQDLSRLESTLQNNGPDDPAPIAAFEKIRTKYHEDTYFCQYMEQIQSGFQSGQMDQQTCDDIEQFHNSLFDQQQDYAEKRHSMMRAEYGFLLLMVIMFWLIVVTFGWSNYMQIYAQSVPGHLISLIFIFILSVALGMAYKYDHDESLMTM